MSEVPTKKIRSANFSKSEIDLLVNLVLKYSKIVENKLTDAYTWKEKLETWNKITSEFNSKNNGPTRTMLSLKTKYECMKKEVRKKAAANKHELFRTGGGTAKTVPLTSSEEIIYNIIQLSVDGLQARYDDNCNTQVETEAEEETILVTLETDDSIPSIVQPSLSGVESQYNSDISKTVEVDDSSQSLLKIWKPKTPISKELKGSFDDSTPIIVQPLLPMESQDNFDISKPVEVDVSSQSLLKVCKPNTPISKELKGIFDDSTPIIVQQSSVESQDNSDISKRVEVVDSSQSIPKRWKPKTLKTPISKELQVTRKKHTETKLQAAEKVSLLSSAKKQLIDLQIQFYEAQLKHQDQENIYKLRKAETELKREELEIEIKILEKKIKEETLKKLLQNTLNF